MSLQPRGPEGSMPPMWTIYRRPRDRPDAPFFVRLWYGEGRTEDCQAFDTLDDARRRIQECGGSFNLGRMGGDDPVIVETWI